MGKAAKAYYKGYEVKEQNSSVYFWKPSALRSRFIVKEGNVGHGTTNPPEFLEGPSSTMLLQNCHFVKPATFYKSIVFAKPRNK